MCMCVCEVEGGVAGKMNFFSHSEDDPQGVVVRYFSDSGATVDVEK